jgi:hypothetical protein
MEKPQKFKVVFSIFSGCAVGISDIMWSVTVEAESESEAIQKGIDQARIVNAESGLPPHGIRVREQDLHQLALIWSATH